jgi:hypothetical protein
LHERNIASNSDPRPLRPTKPNRTRSLAPKMRPRLAAVEHALAKVAASDDSKKDLRVGVAVWVRAIAPP